MTLSELQAMYPEKKLEHRYNGHNRFHFIIKLTYNCFLEDHYEVLGHADTEEEAIKNAYTKLIEKDVDTGEFDGE